jgi:hypothetical protein
MSVPFGFSVGDIIAGIGVLKTSIGAFSDTRGAANEYERHSTSLDSLSGSLEALRKIPVDPAHDSQQHAAIIRSVGQCQQFVDEFLSRINIYDLLKAEGVPRSWAQKLKAAAKKVQWALYQKDEITKFRNEVQQQVDTIGLLVSALEVWVYVWFRMANGLANYR